jgi:pantoate--beta-alanine ligase
MGGSRIGLVPTMGAFHEGHLSLMRRARERCGLVVVSLFVNPTQFNERSDLERYPRDEQRDAAMAESAGVDILFAPGVEEVYPYGFATTVEVSGISEPLEGEMRGTSHFRGVATVVAKLFNMVQPDDAFFGQKDAQQALLIRRMTRDLDFPVYVDVCPTVREADGLAMSSRNALLDPASRQRATALSRALFAIERAVVKGERDAERALGVGREILAGEGIEPEYLAAVAADTLAPVKAITAETLIPIAARVGSVRLIDNVIVRPEPAA